MRPSDSSTGTCNQTPTVETERFPHGVVESISLSLPSGQLSSAWLTVRVCSVLIFFSVNTHSTTPPWEGVGVRDALHHVSLRSGSDSAEQP